MGLLAGERRKQKIGLDPNNLTWRKDTSSVGQSMLKKMGWKEGAGLGANEDGRVAPVKASMKSNTAGLGCTAQQADSWIAHGEEFDQILASLNASNKIENGTDSDSSAGNSAKDEVEGQRRFYGRFSRGGVKRLRTAEDLDCIFGRRKLSTQAVDNSNEKTKSEKSNHDDSSEEKNESQDKDVDKSHGVETVTSSYSVQDYFAQKMKKLKQKKEDMGGVKTLETADNNHDVGKQEPDNEIQDFNSYVTSSFSVNDYFSQKMKLKNEKQAATDCISTENKEVDCEQENSVSLDFSNADKGAAVDLGEDINQIDIKVKKKKKKRKVEDVEMVEENSVRDEDGSIDVSPAGEKTDKKKKNKRKRVDVEIHSDDKTEKKKKKRKTKDVEISNDDDIVVNSRTEEKAERKRKKETEQAVQFCNDSVLVESAGVLEEGETAKKKKKKKKRKNEIQS